MHILDLIFPKRCVGCGRVGQYFCLYCRQTIRQIATNEAICPVCEKPAMDGATHPKCRSRYSLDGLTSFFHYDGVVRRAIKSLKYRLVSDLALEFVVLVPQSLLSYLSRSHRVVIVPIPLHHTRLKERGFNQAELFGAAIADRLHMPLRGDMLHRTVKTAPQVAVKLRKDRLKNMEGVFAVSSHQKTQVASVILFDDVFTTGATMRAAANVLKRNGVRHVWAVTMAR